MRRESKRLSGIVVPYLDPFRKLAKIMSPKKGIVSLIPSRKRVTIQSVDDKQPNGLSSEAFVLALSSCIFQKHMDSADGTCSLKEDSRGSAVHQ